MAEMEPNFHYLGAIFYSGNHIWIKFHDMFSFNFYFKEIFDNFKK